MIKSESWVPRTLMDLSGAEGVRRKFLDRQFSRPTATPENITHRDAAEKVLGALFASR